MRKYEKEKRSRPNLNHPDKIPFAKNFQFVSVLIVDIQ